jgi:hypothetical protein
MMLRIRLRPVLCIASIDPSIIHNHYATTQYPLPTTYYPERFVKGIKDETQDETNLAFYGLMDLYTNIRSTAGGMINEREYQIKPV